jgi:hypothetical protein
MHNEWHRGQRPGAAIKYLRRTTSGAAGIGLGITIKYLRGAVGFGLGTTTKYLRGAAGISLGTTIRYLRRTTSTAAGNGLCTPSEYLVNQNAGADNNWAKAHYKNAGREFCLINLLCSGFCSKLRVPHRGDSLGSCVCWAQACSGCSS